jgi:hypothetical protein
MQYYYIYVFNAAKMKWNRIEWLHLPINHGPLMMCMLKFVHKFKNLDGRPCTGIQVLDVVFQNTLLLITN